MTRYILKEYGSWSVLIISCLAAIITTGSFNLKAAVSFISLSLLINSKQAFTLWMRSARSEALQVFLLQAISASVLIMVFLWGDLIRLLPYAFIPIAYMLLLYLAGEHALITQVVGFALLTLSSLIIKFATSGDIDIRLYIAVMLFCASGVFKVRLQLKRGLSERLMMILYLGLIAFVYQAYKIPAALLLPLIDNIVFSLTLYKVKLKTLGWIEVVKGVLFLFIISNSWM
ncbi:MAG: hypothetical protein L0Y62_00400 [Nitrospirae bacterium]|nr:hypothetical protein [Nitrospirota bacterium]